MKRPWPEEDDFFWMCVLFAVLLTIAISVLYVMVHRVPRDIHRGGCRRPQAHGTERKAPVPLRTPRPGLVLWFFMINSVVRFSTQK